MKKKMIITLLTVLVLVVPASAQEPAQDPWGLGGRSLPIPSGASIELQADLASIDQPNRFLTSLLTNEDLVLFDASDADVAAAEEMRERFANSSVTYRADTVADVPVYFVEPEEVAPQYNGHVFLNLHGGTYIEGSGEAGLLEAFLLAEQLQISVVAVDYRIPREAPFPAALDDAFAVYNSLIAEQLPETIVVGGTSAGGGLTLALMHRLIADDIEVPGVLFAGTPWSDLTQTGDSYYLNRGADRTLITYEGPLAAAAGLYSDGVDLRNPLLSPIYGDFEGFPPTFLISGTRDLFLSNTVRVHAAMRAADVDADLMVFEGHSHADYLRNDQPEALLFYRELDEFLTEQLP